MLNSSFFSLSLLYMPFAERRPGGGRGGMVYNLKVLFFPIKIAQDMLKKPCVEFFRKLLLMGGRLPLAGTVERA
jgi:hypothetical protein